MLILSVQGPWDYSELLFLFHISKHCVSLSWACLPVRKYCRVFAFEEVLNMPLRYLLVDLILRWEFAENRVKTITVFPIINHSSIVLKIERYFNSRPQPTVDPDFCHLLLLLLIIQKVLFNLTLNHGFRDMNWNLVNGRRVQALNSALTERARRLV